MTQTEWQDSILSRFKNIKQTKTGYVASCPAHEDKNPSLLISFKEIADGARANITCLAKCEWASIVSAAGLNKKDVYFHANNGHKLQTTTPPASKERAFIDIDFAHPAKIYSYTDETGQELYQNCRYEADKLGNKLEKKTFRQRHKIGDEWAYALNGIRRVPYNFKALIAEPNIVFDCEGEKDAETLNQLGFTATSTLKESFGELHKFCLGKVVVVCEDNDEPGRKKAEEKAEKYWDMGAETVKVWTFRDMPDRSDVTDWIAQNPQEREFFEIAKIVQDLPAYNPLQAITIDFLREVVPRRPVIEIDGRNALPSGNIGGLVAGIGMGKSPFIEIIASCAVQEDCDPHSMVTVNLHDGDRVAFIDTEQPEDDCQEILYRIHRRTGQKTSHLTPDRKEFKALSVISFISLELGERREKLKMVMKRPEYKLILIDGLLDFVANPNDPAECALFVLWLHAQSAKYDKAVFCIIHGNRNDISGKGKGWLGDIFQRKATCFLMLRKHKIDPKIRVITTAFDNVKFRHGDDSELNIAMQWDEDLKGHKCLPYPEEDETKLTPAMIFAQCFQKARRVEMKKKDLVTWYCDVTGKGEATAYREIDKAVGTILQRLKLQYSLVQNSEDGL